MYFPWRGDAGVGMVREGGVGVMAPDVQGFASEVVGFPNLWFRASKILGP